MDAKIKKYVLDTLAKGSKTVNDKYADPKKAQKHLDRAGNGDEVFNAAKVKEFDRGANRFGNDQDASETKYNEYNSVAGDKQDGQYGKPYSYVEELIRDAVENKYGLFKCTINETKHMNAQQKVQRDAIIKTLMAKAEEYKQRYGQKWKSAMNAEASKMVNAGDDILYGTLVEEYNNDDIKKSTYNKYHADAHNHIKNMKDLLDAHKDRYAKDKTPSWTDIHEMKRMSRAVGDMHEMHAQDYGHAVNTGGPAFPQTDAGPNVGTASMNPWSGFTEEKNWELVDAIVLNEKYIGPEKLAEKYLKEENFSIMDLIQLASINEEKSLELEQGVLDEDGIKTICDFYNLLSEENKEKFDKLIEKDFDKAIETINEINKEED